MAIDDLICSYYTVAGHSPRTGAASPIDFAARARACAEAGYKGIGVHLRDYAAIRAAGTGDAELRAILADNDLRHVEVEFLVDWFATGAAGERSRRDEETLYQAAEGLGARVMFLTGDLRVGNALSMAELQESFAALGARAAARGVTIGVEPCAWSNIGTVGDAVELIRGSGVANAGLFLDLWHLYRRGLDYESLRALSADLVVGVQLDDARAEMIGSPIDDCLDRRMLPGQGAARTADFVRVLIDMGIDVPLSVEVISDEQRERPLAEAARASFDAARAVLVQAREPGDAGRRGPGA